MMKKILTFLCAIAFTGSALLAQNTADTIKVIKNNTESTPFVCFQGGAIADITHQGIRTFANPAIGLDIARFSVKAGYEYQLGFWGNREGEHTHQIKLGIAYTF